MIIIVIQHCLIHEAITLFINKITSTYLFIAGVCENDNEITDNRKYANATHVDCGQWIHPTGDVWCQIIDTWNTKLHIEPRKGTTILARFILWNGWT